MVFLVYGGTCWWKSQVIKCLLPRNGAFSFEQEFAQLEDGVSKAKSNVRIMTDVLSKEDLRTLMASVDVFVSLHRSEGYGLVLLEMLMLGKPVIATGYSGNMQLLGYALTGDLWVMFGWFLLISLVSQAKQILGSCQSFRRTSSFCGFLINTFRWMCHHTFRKSTPLTKDGQIQMLRWQLRRCISSTPIKAFSKAAGKCLDHSFGKSLVPVASGSTWGPPWNSSPKRAASLGDVCESGKGGQYSSLGLKVKRNPTDHIKKHSKSFAH